MANPVGMRRRLMRAAPAHVHRLESNANKSDSRCRPHSVSDSAETISALWTNLGREWKGSACGKEVAAGFLLSQCSTIEVFGTRSGAAPSAFQHPTLNSGQWCAAHERTQLGLHAHLLMTSTWRILRL